MCVVVAVAPVPTTVSVAVNGTLRLGAVGVTRGLALVFVLVPQAVRANTPAAHSTPPNILKVFLTLMNSPSLVWADLKVCPTIAPESLPYDST
jgi:hypothetical protein